ncbi:molecular chaperone DnaJ [Sesbania bispinosa]|nr:molecular chaperone DnaJ [Sesbania bispinosa]
MPLLDGRVRLLYGAPPGSLVGRRWRLRAEGCTEERAYRAKNLMSTASKERERRATINVHGSSLAGRWPEE